jgi:hypothetical protein
MRVRYGTETIFRALDAHEQNLDGRQYPQRQL